MKKRLLTMAAAVFALSMLLGTTCFAREFDASFYAKTYPDVVNVLGSDATALYKHYVTSGQSEGRLPYEGASKGEAVEAPSGTTDEAVPQQPAAAKTYDLRDLKTIFDDHGWNFIDSHWLSIAQREVNNVLNRPNKRVEETPIVDECTYYRANGGHSFLFHLVGTEINLGFVLECRNIINKSGDHRDLNDIVRLRSMWLSAPLWLPGYNGHRQDYFCRKFDEDVTVNKYT
ncbi:MAG: hypothetical protein E7300_12530 [Lachnospiraceae bacterium]|nr:hypothetical protein [Lachnospiraceae bacterium]